MVTSRQDLEVMIGQRVRYFAFPYGHYHNLTTESFVLAHKSGYRGICSAYGGYNFPGDNPFHLQRIHADDDLIRLKNWVTVDPRKLRRVRRFVIRPQRTVVYGQDRAAILGELKRLSPSRFLGRCPTRFPIRSPARRPSKVSYRCRFPNR